MSIILNRELEPRLSGREIAAEASSEFPSAPSYEEMWGAPRRPANRPPSAPCRDRWPVFATLIAIIIGATALIALRERIVKIVPPAASVYRAAGLPVNLAGLELRDVRSRIVMDGPRRVLTVEGEIVNIRREQNRVPPVTLAVRGENGLERYSWTAPAPKSRLDAGEKIAFRARLASPPSDGAEVLVRFAKLEPAKAPEPLAPKRLQQPIRSR
jgi:hypothetical protein